MLQRGKLDRGVLEIVDTESLVPQNHLLRKIDAAVNWERLYEMVEPLYSEDNSRPSIDPVVLVKIVFIQYLFGIRSMRPPSSSTGARSFLSTMVGEGCALLTSSERVM